MMICKNCGETEKFEKTVYGIEHYSETCYIDGESEEETDHGNYNVNDGEQTDESNTICSKCQNESVLYGLSEKELLEIQWKHQNKEGEWQEEELPPEERNQRSIRLILLTIKEKVLKNGEI